MVTSTALPDELRRRGAASDDVSSELSLGRVCAGRTRNVQMKDHGRTTTYSDVSPGDAHDYVSAHDGWSVFARYFHSRLHAVTEQLRAVPGGALLDVGCGPGVLVRHLVDTRPGDFEITGLDRSPAMVRAAESRLRDVPGVDLVVGRAEDLPLPDATFDVALAMGVLEYTDSQCVIREMARVTRPGGLAIVTMLNPGSLYRWVDWGMYSPGLRLAGRVEALAGVPAERRHDCPKTGIRAHTVRSLRRHLRASGLEPYDVVYYDLTPTVPPLDRVARRVNRRWREHPETTIGRGARGWMGTAFLISARRQPRGQLVREPSLSMAR